MSTILTVVHIAVCFFLVTIVLLQHGKGADAGAAFGGGGSSQSLFGSEGPVPLMNKITTVVAVVFMLTSITLAYMSATSSTGSVMSSVDSAAIEETAVPVTEQVVPMPTAEVTEEVAPQEAPKAQE